MSEKAPMQSTPFVSSTGETRNPIYEGQFEGETAEQAEARLHWAKVAMEMARNAALSALSHGEQVREVVPEGWAVRQVSDDGDVGFVVGAPRDEAGVRASTSVWEGDSDPAHLLLWHMLAAAPSAPSHGEQVREGWQLVPVEPTDAMLEAGDKYIGTPATYKAMLSACPSPAITKDFSQFLSAVMDAAGLIRHGRQSKELSEYLGMKCMEYRGVAPSAGSQGGDV